MGPGDHGRGSLAGLIGGVAMAWFPQMWAAAVLLNGRLLRENALQGAEQLGAEIDQPPITCLIKINGNKKSLEELTRYGMDFFNIWLNK